MLCRLRTGGAFDLCRPAHWGLLIIPVGFPDMKDQGKHLGGHRSAFSIFTHQVGKEWYVAQRLPLCRFRVTLGKPSGPTDRHWKSGERDVCLGAKGGSAIPTKSGGDNHSTETTWASDDHTDM